MRTIEGLHVLVDRKTIHIVPEIIEGGASVIQLRDKTATEDELVTAGNELREMIGEHVIFIVNDNPELARKVGADGVHVGQTDMAAEKAREIIGEEKILGISASNLEEAQNAVKDRASYIGLGPIFSTSSKQDAATPLGKQGLEAVRLAVPDAKLVVIGGINPATLKDVMQFADGAAVISAVTGAENHRRATEGLVEAIKKASPVRR